SDSPVGQAAWIVEKFWSWMDCGETDGHPENILTRDELLDNISTYWFSNAGASSARLYWESLNDVNLAPITIPVGCSIFPKEILFCSRRWAEQRFSQLIHWKEFDSGGHFAALEKPDCLIEEIRNCFKTLR
ncbi:MAG: pimeloyl-ACP methyl ester carboxylesterase, partial [Halieaceae bacterium]